MNIKLILIIKNGEVLSPVKVSLKETNDKFQLFVNSEPFYIKGAGLEFGDIASLAKHGGNSFRTWRTENGQRSGKEVLDEAHEHGLYVMMGIEVARERHGFDYNDENAVKEQFERIKKEVTALKDHPALLIWGIGNELNLRYTNPKVWDAVNDISKMIHEIDPNHLTTTSLAGFSKKDIAYIKERCSDIDILSVQLYGAIYNLPEILEASGWDGPLIVSEWGATGHWEVPKTAWGVPIEQNSTLKAKEFHKRYEEVILENRSQIIGSYMFLWGQKQERTPTWYGVFLEDGTETEAVDIMHYVWNGERPLNQSPKIQSFSLDNRTAYDSVYLKAGNNYVAEIKMADPDNDDIAYQWELLPESTDLQDGGDFEKRPESLEIKSIKNEDGKLEFTAPATPGPYRLFVYGYDGNGHAATANIPFFVN